MCSNDNSAGTINGQKYMQYSIVAEDKNHIDSQIVVYSSVCMNELLSAFAEIDYFEYHNSLNNNRSRGIISSCTYPLLLVRVTVFCSTLHVKKNCGCLSFHICRYDYFVSGICFLICCL